MDKPFKETQSRFDKVPIFACQPYSARMWCKRQTETNRPRRGGLVCELCEQRSVMELWEQSPVRFRVQGVASVLAAGSRVVRPAPA